MNKFQEASAKDMARFRSKYVVMPDGCWLWRPEEKHNKKGYAYFWFNGKWRRAHKFMWQQNRKRLVGYDRNWTQLELDHMCNRRNCVNPRHVQEVTHAINILMIYRRGQDSYFQPAMQLV